MALLHYTPPLSPYLDILYQDDDIIVLNKPSGLLSVPGKAVQHKDSLQLRVMRVFPTATIVHRLDMATSGILIMALNKDSHRQISKQFELRETKKRYIARVCGEVATDKGEIELPLICDWPNRPKQKVCYEYGKKALTRWRVIQRRSTETLMELIPHTGRSHQLRVHMLRLGHPILGDRLYAPPEALSMANRLQLHANQLAFKHPKTQKWMDFVAPCPF